MKRLYAPVWGAMSVIEQPGLFRRFVTLILGAHIFAGNFGGRVDQPFFKRRETTRYFISEFLDAGCDAITEKYREPWELGRLDWGFGRLIRKLDFCVESAYLSTV